MLACQLKALLRLKLSSYNVDIMEGTKKKLLLFRFLREFTENSVCVEL